ncbi:taurine dioxygenase [Caulobacter ginsengisoli]|uniref:Taurine dioxygenase n=1 Tax=Caulobacter ginsengisoli TaxID=400775 RepID=A0ABU0IPJ3_9CAUL|nr:TauD/TfdA family dioxygenase [Caulobacter ginsengisoli]MDQ0463306.1 taurine dioxygenase [Caulobacter ginsengisoli]
MPTSVIAIERQSGCGALVSGVDLASAGPREVDLMRKALFDHGVLFFRDQTLTQAQHIALAEQFAPIDINRFFPADADYPQIAKVEKTQEQTSNIGGGWHTDHSYDAEPAMGSILVARQLPDKGGDTLFADMYGAFDSLDDALKARLKTMRAVHSTAQVFGAAGAYAGTDQQALSGSRDLPETIHPVIIRHPGSGKPVLYVNPAFTTRFEGMTREESLPLLQQLFVAAIDPARVTTFKWKPGSVAIWDNRASWHFAKNDYHGQYRLMHRITMSGCALEAA